MKADGPRLDGAATSAGTGLREGTAKRRHPRQLPALTARSPPEPPGGCSGKRIPTYALSDPNS